MADRQDYQPQLRDAFQATRIIGYSTSLSVIVYGLIARFILARYPAEEPAPDASAVWVKIIGFAGGVLFLGPAVLRRQLLRFSRPAKLTVESATRQLQGVAMVIFGCCETISILGLVAAILTRDMQNYYWLAFLSLLGFAIYFPQFERWDRHVLSAVNPYLSTEGRDGKD